MDSDLAESVSALKDIFNRRGLNPQFGTASAEVVAGLKEKLKIPRRYRDFLTEANPVDVETATPIERVRLIPAEELEAEQSEQASSSGWRPAWVVIAHSALLGDPYFLDISKLDAEGDCPVFTAMSGTDSWQPRLCASSFALFIRILAVGMEVAQGFANDDEFDMDDDHVFREAVGPKIRQYDPAALKAGHWT